MSDSPTQSSFSIKALLVLTALTAFAYLLLKHVGFGDQYYVSQVENECRRFGFAVSLALAMQATIGLIAQPKSPCHWVGLRVMLGFGMVLALRYTPMPNALTGLFMGDPDSTATLEVWFVVVPILVCFSTFIAFAFANYKLVWGVSLALSMIAELAICLLFMVMRRTPRPLWDTYQIYREYEPGMLLIGLLAIATLGFFALRNKTDAIGLLASFTFLTVSAFTRLYEQFIL